MSKKVSQKSRNGEPGSGPGREVGLTGGIGSGKSTVANMLVKRGAALVDADKIVRELQEPGQPVFLDMVEHFGESVEGGESVVLEDGTLNRKAIAEIVFNNPDELEKLNKMVHPPLQERMESMREQFLAEGKKVVVDFPLLAESNYTGFNGVIVVDCDIDVAVKRLVEDRGFSEADARARISNQASREERLKVADFVIDNSAGLEALEEQVQECWEWICSL